MSDAFEKDCLEILGEKARRGGLSRRQFAQLAAVALAGAPLALRSGSVRAAERQLVLVNWGGDAIKAYDQAYGQPFFKETGIEVKEDGTGPTEGAIAPPTIENKTSAVFPVTCVTVRMIGPFGLCLASAKTRSVSPGRRLAAMSTTASGGVTESTRATRGKKTGYFASAAGTLRDHEISGTLS